MLASKTLPTTRPPGIGVAGAVADERIVDLPPEPECRPVVPPNLDVRLICCLRDLNGVHPRTAPADQVVEHGRPGRPAVDADVDVDIHVGEEGEEVLVEADDRRIRRRQVDARRDQRGVLGVAGAEEVAVDDREGAVAARQVSSSARVVERPGLAVPDRVGHGPPGRQGGGVEVLAQRLGEVELVAGRRAGLLNWDGHVVVGVTAEHRHVLDDTW